MLTSSPMRQPFGLFPPSGNKHSLRVTVPGIVLGPGETASDALALLALAFRQQENHDKETGHYMVYR